MHRESGARRDLRIREDPHRPEPEDRCIGIFRRAAKMIADTKAGRIDAAKFSIGSDSDHDLGKMR